jgi:vacuolar protein sorting-associated protein 45
MVHELIGITNNRVPLPHAANADAREVVLSAEHDQFFKTNMYANFGELGENMKQLVDSFQAKTKSTQQIDSIGEHRSRHFLAPQIVCVLQRPPACSHAMCTSSASTNRLISAEDMKKFVANYPAFRELSGNVEKHVALVSELSRLVEDVSRAFLRW